MPEHVTGKPPLANLTSLRFFAACYVLLFHTRGGMWFRSGITGVTLFFVLSGFILAYNYPVVPAGKRSRFYLSRVARIYPLYVVSCFAMFPYVLPKLAPGSGGFLARSTIVYLLFLQTWLPPFHFRLNAGGWTLSVEALFYVIFPFIIGWLGRFRNRWVKAIAICYAILLVPNLLSLLVWLPSHPAQGSVVHAILSLPVFHLGEFFIGALFGLHFLDCRPVFQGRAVLGATALCLVVLVCISPIPSGDYEIVLNGLMALPYGLLIYTMAGWKSRIFSHPILQLGGEISFSIYLLQWVLVDLVQRLFKHSRGLSPLRFALFLAGAYVSYQLIEKPSRRLLLRLFRIKSHSKPIETLDPSLP
jgi:peptidoglycan/LPS O-acetylase OafA/YrhL